MSNFLIFKAAFNNSATPAIGTYTAEGATAQFNINTSLSPDYYLYNTADDTAVQWFVPTAETTDFEFVADILTRQWTNRVTYFIIADSTGTTRLRMWSQHSGWYFENSDSTGTAGNPEYIGVINPTTSGGSGVFHQFRVRVRKLTASSSSVEVYVDGTLKLTAIAGAALVTCTKIGFVGGVRTFGPGTDAGVKNAYVYDLSDGDVVNPGVLSGAFNRFISWMKSKFALKSDIPTVNDGTLTIKVNGATAGTFTANASTNATANIQCVDLTNNQTVGGQKIFSDTWTFVGRDLYHFAASPYGKNTPPANTSIQYIWFGGNTASQGFTNSWYSGYIEQLINTDGSTRGRWLIRDTSENSVGIELWVNGSDKQVRPQSNNAIELGSTTNKWKLFNGINPGALSLPNVNDGVVTVDTTSFAWNTGWDYTPVFDGWISVLVQASSATKRRYSATQGYLRYWYPNQNGEIFRFSFPVVKDVPIGFGFISDIEEPVAPTIYLLKSQGNV